MDKDRMALEYGIGRLMQDIDAVSRERSAALLGDPFGDVTIFSVKMERLETLRDGFRRIAELIEAAGPLKVVATAKRRVYYADSSMLEYTPQREYTIPLLKILAASSLSLRPKDVLEGICKHLELTAGDLATTGSGKNIRWKSMAYHQLYHTLRAGGYAIRGEDQRWSITPKGRIYLATLVSSTRR